MKTPYLVQLQAMGLHVPTLTDCLYTSQTSQHASQHSEAVEVEAEGRGDMTRMLKPD